MTPRSDRRFAVWLLALVLGALVLAGSLGQLLGDPDGTHLERARGPVVLFGAPGLSWDDLDPRATPALWDMLAEGASGALVVRGAVELTCPADGWLTLSAGQRAAVDSPGQQDCSRALEATPPGTVIPPWATWQRAADQRPLDAQLGTLAGALTSARVCLEATGPLAEIGAATPDGRTPASGGSCPVRLVGTGPVEAPAMAADVDSALADILAETGPDATVIVAGLADRDDRPGLRVVLMTGPSVEPGTLTSPSTRQPGLVQTTDLTATLLTLAGVTPPGQVAGEPVAVIAAGPGGTDPVAVTGRQDLAQDLVTRSAEFKLLPLPFLGIGALLGVAALVLAAWRDRRAGQAPYPGLRTALVGTGLLAGPSSSFLAMLVPWWRVGPPGSLSSALLFAVVLATLAFAHLALAWGGPWRRSPLGPVTVILAMTVVVLGCDVILGSRLSLSSMYGVQPLLGGRYYGMGNAAFGIIATATVILAGLLAALVRSRGAAVLCVVTLGLAVTVVDGAPGWGADFGGVPSLLLAMGVLAVAAAGMALTWRRVLLLGALAVLGGVLLLVVDWLRPPDSRTHLGQFVQTVLDGGGGEVVLRKLDQSVGIVLRYPLSWIAVVLVALASWALLRPRSPLGRLLAPMWRVPMLHQTAVAVLVLWVVGWAINDSGVAIAGNGLFVAVTGFSAVAARAAPGDQCARPATRPDTAGPGAVGSASPGR